MYIVIEILTEENNSLRLIGDQIFPSIESAEKFISSKVQKQVDMQANHIVQNSKKHKESLEFINNHPKNELVVKNLVIIAIEKLITVQNNHLF